MDFSDYSLVIVDKNTIIKPFDCGDDDLNEFLLEKSILYSKELLATTYILEKDSETIAFFSIFNDNIRAEEMDFASKSALRRFLSEILPHGKRHLKYFPAIKIGRLGVSNNLKNKGAGRSIISFIIDLALTQNVKCACKFISVDAYAKSLGFYEKLGFTYLTNKDEEEETRQMYLDLTPIINATSVS